MLFKLKDTNLWEKQLQIGCQETLIPSPDHSLKISYEKIYFQFYSLCYHYTQESGLFFFFNLISLKKKESGWTSMGHQCYHTD